MKHVPASAKFPFIPGDLIQYVDEEDREWYTYNHDASDSVYITAGAICSVLCVTRQGDGPGRLNIYELTMVNSQSGSVCMAQAALHNWTSRWKKLN